MWQCPLCQHALDTSSTTWRCDNNHTFDQAKSGYINLLPVQNKRSREPGDDKVMLTARRDFHQTLGYKPLMQKIVQIIGAHFSEKNSLTVYEAGCGEGAYLRFIQKNLIHEGAVFTAGNDIAKAAVDMAAKLDKRGQFVVASSFSLPVMEQTVDVLLLVFAPGDHNEFARVLADKGVLITVDPGPEHLIEMKKVIYETPEKHSPPSASSGLLNIVEELPLTFSVSLEDDKRRNGLIGMTPLCWKLSEQTLATLHHAVKTVTADFVIRVWCKHS
ncbi:putative RNA methyltransferase [Salinimonas chungwhensis]|uniref:putative RNA methyltransferase n=1 Tax=Salinimonas chungwhensis TaxID=265425 RepID=UPI0003776B42|nr:methyltransferase domain-containing protein [Salinimonas chungwhensis]